jgi:hypothetical protein
MPFFEGKLLNKTLTIKILKNYVFLGNYLVNISSQKRSLKKMSIYVCFLRPKLRNPKCQSNGPAPVRA